MRSMAEPGRGRSRTDALKWAALATALLFGILLISLVAWAEVGSRQTSERLRSRREHWTRVVELGVPVGTAREDAERFLRTTVPADRAPSYDPDQHELVAAVESLDVVGLTFPCGSWVLVAQVHIGPDNRVTSRSVTQAGICV